MTVVGAFAALVACGDNGISREEIAKIEVSEGQRPVAANGAVSVSPSLPTRLRISNTGNGALMVKDIAIESTPAGAFTVTSLPVPSAEAPVEVWPDSLGHSFSIAYDATVVGDGARPKAVVRIRTNTTLNSGTEFVFNVTPEQSLAKLVLSPPSLDFGLVSANQSSTKPVSLLNTGSADLTVSRIVFGGHPGYTVSIAGQSYSVSAESASTGITLPSPLVIAGGSATTVDVTYTASGPESAQGQVVFFSNDATAANGTTLNLFANLTGPCIKVNPMRVEFGSKVVGQLAQIDVEVESCGDVDLILNDVVIATDPSGVFGVQKSQIGVFPLTVAAHAKVVVPVTYLPGSVAVLGNDGQFVQDEGLLQITSNAYLSQVDIPLRGFGTDGRCPVAKITIAEGAEVIPQTNLHLSGRQSTSSNGTINNFEWTVIQPNGSTSTLRPSKFVAEPTFEANIIGEYIFRLKVFDALGNESCSDAEQRVIVTSNDAIHVELLWNTPTDADQTDLVGADVDLHFLHPSAAGAYFHQRFDCYWENTTPEWGFASPQDNPRLDRDDVDGAGPENLNVDVPEQGVRYQVGVHYWDDWGFGPSTTTVRIYIYGQLRDQWADVRLVVNDMWDTHYIDWPSGVVTRITRPGGVPQITANFPIPNSSWPF
ncbi:MAG: choice-of-anchor D domain-containing protein [Deltaproteobacteria bacterium]|nr:choice-of-anchor D domain-containing protein [Deltaproteobacteria bacterium]